MEFTKVQLRAIIGNHVRRENGLNDVIEWILNALMRHERSEHLTDEESPNRANCYRQILDILAEHERKCFKKCAWKSLDRLVQFSLKWSLIPISVGLARIGSKQGQVVVEFWYDPEVSLLFHGHFPEENDHRVLTGACARSIW